MSLVFYFQHLLIDVNECSARTDQCQQVCQNTIGSYVCSCNSGFILDVDGRTCDGILKFFKISAHI